MPLVHSLWDDVGPERVRGPFLFALPVLLMFFARSFRYNRPPWTTGILIPASFLCGIAAAVIIARGGSKTKRRAEVEERLRVALDMEKSGDRHGLIRDFADQQQVIQNRAGREVKGLIMIPTQIGEVDEDDAEQQQKDDAVVQVFGGRAGHLP